jgi:hypothetical protein
VQLGTSHCGSAVSLTRLCYLLIVHLYGQPYAVLLVLHCHEGMMLFLCDLLERLQIIYFGHLSYISLV